MNIEEISRIVGVSPTTVSRVINNSDLVKESTRKKVLEVIKEFEFVPNRSASSLAAKKNKTIGVVSYCLLNDPFYAQISECIYFKAAERDYNVFFSVNMPHTRLRLNALDALYGRVDGVILLGEDSVERQEVIKYSKKKFPLAIFENKFSIPDVINVNVDNYDGAYQATQYLIQLGHKKIAHFYGKKGYFESDERLNGYCQALADNGLEKDDSLLFEGSYSFRKAYELAPLFLKSGASAAFCSSDTMAHGLRRGIKANGFTVPQDYSVVGFDDITFGNYVPSLALTTVHQPHDKIAQYLIDSLIDRIEKGSVAPNVVFKPELVIKESAAQYREH